jgi:DNA-binding MarR family transcriptional regulator
MSDRPLPTVIGPTENALRALLVQTLDATRIRGYEEWVLLNMTDAAAPMHAIAAALRVARSRISGIADELVRRGLLADPTRLTAEGRTELAAGRVRVREMTVNLTAGIPPEHEEVCRQVLDTIRKRAEDELAAAAAECHQGCGALNQSIGGVRGSSRTRH